MPVWMKLGKGERIGIFYAKIVAEGVSTHHQTLTMNANKTKFLLTRVGAIIANNGQ